MNHFPLLSFHSVTHKDGDGIRIQEECECIVTATNSLRTH